MKRAAFATLCGVSKQQVSKYATAGKIVVDGDEVDAEASLAMLEGRLDEAKRQRALAAISSQPQPTVAASAAPAPRVVTTAKAERDAVERDLKLLEYGRQAGELVPVAEVEDICEQAIGDMRETFTAGRRELAIRICADFGLPPEKTVPLQRALTAGFEACMGRFAERMSGAPDPAEPQSPAAARNAVPESATA